MRVAHIHSEIASGLFSHYELSIRLFEAQLEALHDLHNMFSFSEEYDDEGWDDLIGSRQEDFPRADIARQRSHISILMSSLSEHTRSSYW